MGMRVEEKGVARLDAVLATGFSFCPTWSVGKKLVVVVADQGAVRKLFYTSSRDRAGDHWRSTPLENIQILKVVQVMPRPVAPLSGLDLHFAFRQELDIFLLHYNSKSIFVTDEIRLWYTFYHQVLGSTR